jgi:uncharacterized protein (TIGR03066 family)
MRQLRFVGTTFLILCLAACSGKKDDKKDGKDGEKDSGKKSNADKLVGTWEVTKAGPDTPKGAQFEFTKDGKLTIQGKVKIPAKEKVKETEQEFKMEATYKVDGDMMKVTMKLGDMEKTENVKIVELTDSKLVTEDEKKVVEEFKKK